jgi:hypothetical protein
LITLNDGKEVSRPGSSAKMDVFLMDENNEFDDLSEGEVQADLMASNTNLEFL